MTLKQLVDKWEMLISDHNNQDKETLNICIRRTRETISMIEKENQ